MLQIKDITIGKGLPKICVPLVAKNLDTLKQEVNELKKVNFDILEWRIDFFDELNNIETIKEGASYISENLNQPTLFTFRSKKEGGEIEISDDKYFELINNMILSNLIDLIDIELFMDRDKVIDSIALANKNNVKVVMSNHDFNKTPAKEEIVNRLTLMHKLNADICKIAVMPQSSRDVLTLLDATLTMQEINKDAILVTMSMAQLGVISRVCGETFGSTITFGAYKNASAPGQIEVNNLKNVLEVLNQG